MILRNIWVTGPCSSSVIWVREYIFPEVYKEYEDELVGLEGGSGLSLLWGAPGPVEVVYSMFPAKAQSWTVPNTYKPGLGRES